MKKILIISMMLSVSFCFAQKNQSKKPVVKAKSNLEFGLKAGGNLSKIKGKEITREFSEKLGYHAGIVANYHINSNISLQTELLFNNLGTSSKQKEGQHLKAKVQMDYISLPLMLKFQLVPRFYLETGPEISYNISSKYILEEGAVTDWEEYTKSMNLALGVGAGYHITPNMAVNLRMNFSITTPFFSTEDSYAKSFRHQNLQFGLLYFIK